MAQDSIRVTGGAGLGSTSGVWLFVVGFVAGALPVTIIPSGYALPLNTCMTSGGLSHIMEAWKVVRTNNTH